LYPNDRLGKVGVIRKIKTEPVVDVAVAYTRVSTAEQAELGAGLDAQAAAVIDYCSRRGLSLAETFTDRGLSGRSLDRPALREALKTLDDGRANVLVVSKVDRLSRSVLDFSGLLARAEQHGWKIVALDLGVDMTTPSGEMLAAVVAAVAQYERRLIGQRTREALAARRASGVKLGRPRELPAEVAHRIRASRSQGLTLQAIADGLNRDGVSTPTGRLWSPALVRKITLQEAAA